MSDDRLKRMRAASPLLPDPGGEVVRGLIDELEAALASNAELRAQLEKSKEDRAQIGNAAIKKIQELRAALEGIAGRGHNEDYCPLAHEDSDGEFCECCESCRNMMDEARSALSRSSK